MACLTVGDDEVRDAMKGVPDSRRWRPPLCAYIVPGRVPKSPVPFVRGKAVAEQYLRESALAYTILEPNLFMEISCPNIVGGPLVAGQPVTLVGEGNRKHSMISIEDVVSFAVAAARNPRARNRVLVLGGPAPVSWHDVIAVYERLLGRTIEVRFVPMGELAARLP
jgi:uncharacterized protein YbjT (DUF2867 family)